MIRPLSRAEMQELLADVVAPVTPTRAPRPSVSSDAATAAARILDMVDLAPLTRGRRGEALIVMTPAALRAFIDTHGEYSCSFPSLTTIGKRWARDANAYRRPRRPPEWWILEYVELSPPDPKRVAILSRPVRLLGDLGTMSEEILGRRHRRATVRFRGRAAAWFTRAQAATS